MITREELEKMFDETFDELYLHKYAEWYEPYWSFECKDEVKEFIFNTIITKVLKSVIPEENEWYLINFEEDNKFALENIIIQNIKQKAKENFNIDL